MTTNSSARGGRREGAGAKPKPLSEVASVRIVANVTPAEADEWRRRGMSKWLRAELRQQPNDKNQQKEIEVKTSAYVALYAPNPNAASSYCGLGISKIEAQENRLAYNNQVPHTTVSFSRAPKWARKEALTSFYRPCLACGKTHPIGARKAVCIDNDGRPISDTAKWGVIWPECDGEFVVAKDAAGKKTLDEFASAGYPTQV